MAKRSSGLRGANFSVSSFGRLRRGGDDDSNRGTTTKEELEEEERKVKEEEETKHVGGEGGEGRGV